METGTDINKAIACLNTGNLIGIPTETVYGLAANGYNASAVAKIFAAKNRPNFNPLILHVDSIDKAKSLVLNFPEKALFLAETFWPGPLTLVLPKANIVPDIVTAGHSTVAIRIPNHPITLNLLQQLPYPLAAPSANPSGYVSPTKAEHVVSQLGEKVCYVLDGGDCTVGVESTIVKFDGAKASILRYGGITQESIEIIIGKVSNSTTPTNTPDSPGRLRSHYAPKHDIILGNINDNLVKYKDKKIGVLAFNKAYTNSAILNQLVLSGAGSYQEAAANLFNYLRQTDGWDVDIILTETLPNEGLGKAINDRLQRASV